MADAQTFPGYNLAMAGLYPDPTQWSNPYSNYQSSALPFPPSYAGTPTNAMGQPIQSYQAPQQPQSPITAGTTLNTNPNAQWAMQQNMAQAAGQGTQGMGVSPYGYFSQAGGPQGVSGGGRGVAQPGAVWTPTMPQQQQQSAPSAPQPQGVPGSWQNAVNALSNPGNPPMQGAPYQQTNVNPMNAMGTSINNSALQNFQQGGIGQRAQPGIGGGSSGINFGANNAFFNNLKGMQQ